MPDIKTCKFVSLMSLISDLQFTLSEFNNSDIDVSFGDADHTLVNKDYFNLYIRSELQVDLEEEELLSERLGKLPEDCMIDLET